MNDVAEKLREARTLIERGWTQGAFARDSAGDRVYTHSQEAVCYCATGAISHATDPLGRAAMREIRRECFEALADVLDGEDTDDIEDWNDEKGRTQAEVLAAFDRAITLASGIETEGQDASRLGAEHESPTGEAGDAQPPVHKKEDK